MRKIAATTLEEALEGVKHLKRWKPIEMVHARWLIRISATSFKIQSSKPKSLKAGQELYDLR